MKYILGVIGCIAALAAASVVPELLQTAGAAPGTVAFNGLRSRLLLGDFVSYLTLAALCGFGTIALHLLEGIRDRLAVNTSKASPSRTEWVPPEQRADLEPPAPTMRPLFRVPPIQAAAAADPEARHVGRPGRPPTPNLLLHYRDAHGEDTERQVTVLKVEPHTAWLDGKPHEDGCFYAYCHLRHGFRQFRLDRVLSAADAATGEVVTSIAAFASSHGRAVPA